MGLFGLDRHVPVVRARVLFMGFGHVCVEGRYFWVGHVGACDSLNSRVLLRLRTPSPLLTAVQDGSLTKSIVAALPLLLLPRFSPLRAQQPLPQYSLVLRQARSHRLHLPGHQRRLPHGHILQLPHYLGIVRFLQCFL